VENKGPDFYWRSTVHVIFCNTKLYGYICNKCTLYGRQSLFYTVIMQITTVNSY